MDEYIRYNGSRIKNIRGQHFGHLIPQKIVGVKNNMPYGNVCVIYAVVQDRFP